jgi:hypothetical protein
VLRLLREGDLFREVAEGSVDPDAHEALAAKGRQFLAVLALPVAYHRRQDLHAHPFAEVEHAVGHLLNRLAGDRPAAAMAVGLAHPGEQQPQVVGDLGGGAHRRARVLAPVLLLDGNCWRETLDRVDVGLPHLLEELARVGGQ